MGKLKDLTGTRKRTADWLEGDLKLWIKSKMTEMLLLFSRRSSLSIDTAFSGPSQVSMWASWSCAAQLSRSGFWCPKGCPICSVTRESDSMPTCPGKTVGACDILAIFRPHANHICFFPAYSKALLLCGIVETHRYWHYKSILLLDVGLFISNSACNSYHQKKKNHKHSGENCMNDHKIYEHSS